MAGRVAATGPMKSDTARRIRRTAQVLDESHPEMVTGGHLRDAAKVLEHGSVDGAKRHLDAAMETLVPRNLYRHGITDDEGHATAKHVMHEINRHRLAVMDIEDVTGRNQQVMQTRAMQRAGQKTSQLPETQPPAAAQLSNRAVDLSARTAMLQRTPAPRGKPGGPGLYDVKGMGHDPYFQQVVKALIEKRGMPPSKAYPIAYAALRRWRRGGGHVHPEVQAAASGTLAREAAKGAAARAAHGHSNTLGGIELAGWMTEIRDSHGEWSKSAGTVRPLKYEGKPGDFGHIRAVEAVGDKYDPQGELRPNPPPGPGAQVLRTSMRSAARFMAMRNMDAARRALDMAAWGARHTGPDAQRDVMAVRASLAAVPKGVGPQFYTPGPHPASNPLQPMGYSGAPSWTAIDLAVELAAVAVGAGGSGKGKQNSNRPQNSNWQNQSRVQAGSPAGGQFGSGSGGGAQGKGKGSKQARAARKAQLEHKAAGLRAQIRALVAAYRAAVASSHHKVSSKAAKAGKAASPAAAAAAAKKAATARAKTSAPRRKTAATPAQIHGKIIALRAALAGVMAQIHSLANDGPAIELAMGAAAAWQHELRGPHGEFAKSGSSTTTTTTRSSSSVSDTHITSADLDVRLRHERQEFMREVRSMSEKQSHMHTEKALRGARIAHTKLAAQENKAEGRKAGLKLAVHGGALAAGGILAYTEAKLGVPDIVAIGSALGPSMLQEIIDWAKKL